MAWELQTDMTHLIRPSVEAYLNTHQDPAGEAGRILGFTRGEGVDDLDRLEAIQIECDKDVAKFGVLWAACEIAEHAEKVATTSNGAWTFYCDEGGWCDIEFIGEEVAA